MTTDRPVKRSLTIRGHRTSVTLEDAFWEGLRELAAARGASIPAVVGGIDAARDPATNLASAIRLAVLGFYRKRAGYCASGA